jgi:hypothetical protein
MKKKKPAKRKAKAKASSSGMAMMPEPEPFSAHFHATGKTMAELEDKIGTMLKKHVKTQRYRGGRHRKVDRTTVEKALS